MIYKAGDRAEEMYFVYRGVIILERPASAAVAASNPRPLLSSESEKDEAVDTVASVVETLVGPGSTGGVMAGSGDAGEVMAGPGDAFGEAGLFPDVGGAFQGETARVDSEEAELYVLPAGRVAELEGRYPAEMLRLRELCEMRAAEIWARTRSTHAATRSTEGSLAGCRCEQLISADPLPPLPRSCLSSSI